MHRKILATGILMLFIGSILTPIAFGIEILPQSRGDTLYVGGSGPGNYTTIKEAVNDAIVGDTVFVYNDSAPYYENMIYINKSLSLIGEDKHTTIIDGLGGDRNHILSIHGDNIQISGFTLRNCSIDGFDTGIYIRLASQVHIQDNIFINTSIGIRSIASRKLIVNDNYITSGSDKNWTRFGIVTGFSTITIQNNTIQNVRAFGITAQSSRCLIENNIIINGTQPNHQWGIACSSCASTIRGNIIHNFSRGIALEGDIYSGIHVYGILTAVHSNSISNSVHYGLFISESLFTSVKNNNFIDNVCDAYFIKAFFNRWDGNYWDEWDGEGPMVIEGNRHNNYDWHPASEPYVI